MASTYLSVEHIILALSDALIKILKLTHEEKVSISKRNKRLDGGDFVVNVISPSRKAVTASAGRECNSKKFEECAEKVNVASVVKTDRRDLWNLLKNEKFKVQVSPVLCIDAQITSFNDQCNKLFVVLNHSQLGSLLVKDVLQRGEDYGKVKSVDTELTEVCEDREAYLVNCCFTLLKLEQNPAGCTVQDLRTLVIAQYLNGILQHENFNAKLACSNKIEDILKALFEEDKSVEHLQKHRDQPYWKEASEQLLNFVSQSKYKVTADSSSEKDESASVSMYLDLNACFNDERREIYRPNIGQFSKKVDMTVNSERFRQVCTLECHKKELFGSCYCVKFINVISSDLLHQSHQTGKIQDMAFSEDLDSDNIHISVNAVHVRKPTENTDIQNLPNAEHFIRIRKHQVEEAFVMKYGEKPKEYIDLLTSAAVRFEMLITNNLSPLKVNLENEQLDTKGGVFLMYNYARLATLFDKFEEAVESGKYPKLPPISEIDFNLLQEREEWEIIFNYLLMYQAVILDSVKNVQVPHAKFPVHASKFCQFMQDLSNDFSSFYNRIHILCEPYPHLLPQMYARLYLMKALKQIIFNGLKLLLMNPMERL